MGSCRAFSWGQWLAGQLKEVSEGLLMAESGRTKRFLLVSIFLGSKVRCRLIKWVTNLLKDKE